MNFQTHNEKDIDTSRTGFQGYLLDVTYQDLVDAFGESSDSFDPIKGDAEWEIEFDTGLVATIYNYKNGRNYLGEEGLDLEDMTAWNVGGESKRVLELIGQALGIDKL